MKNNLEGIPFEKVVNGDGLSYADFRSGLTPKYGLVYLDIFKGYFALIVLSLLHIYLIDRFPAFTWTIIPVTGLLTGYAAAYLALFLHEAGHFNLHPDKKTNDRIATFVLGLLFGISIPAYRKIHWQHHLHLATPADMEISYFKPISKLFIAEALTGIHLFRTVIKKDDRNILTASQLKKGRFMLVAGIFFHLALLSLFYFTGNWTLAISWILAFIIFFPFFASVRQILEHRDEWAGPARDYYESPRSKISRLFRHNWLSSTFGSAGFTRHMIHHWDPHISYTRLSDIESFLKQNEETNSILSDSLTRYSSVLARLLHLK